MPAPAPTPAPVPVPRPALPPAGAGRFRCDFAALAAWHQRFPGSVQWRLTREGGLEVRRSPDVAEAKPVRTPGRPSTVLRALGWFADEAEAACCEFGVPLELVLACLCAEAVGGARERPEAVEAARLEPGYASDELTPARVSVGPMQTLIATAREALGQPRLGRAELLDPATAIRAGTAYIARQAAHTGFDPVLVGAAYNAGSVRYCGLEGNPWRLMCYPAATGAHVGRFASYFGDALAVLQADPELAGDAPTFAQSLPIQLPAV